MPSIQSTETRLALVEDRQERMEQTLASVAESLKLLARIEAQNSTLANEIKQLREETTALRNDVADIQQDMPALRQIKAGATGAVRMILVAVFVGLLALVGLKITH